MPESPLQTAGAQIDPSSAAPLHTNEFFTGMWTQGNPLGSGAVPFLYQKFYSAQRYDRIVAGQNIEITSKLTLARRPGNSVYNAGPFPPINRFIEFRVFQNQAENIRIMASCDAAAGSIHGTVRDVTAGSNQTIWTKSVAAGKTAFQPVDNILYFADGVDAKKWIQSGQAWAATLAANIASIQVVTYDAGTPSQWTALIVNLTAPAPALQAGTQVTFAGITHYPALNGQTLVWTPIGSPTANQIIFKYAGANYGPTADTGTVTGSNVTFAPGQFIIDSNNNVQLAMGSQTATITHIQVEAYSPGGRKVTLWFDPANPLNIESDIALTLAGLTTVPSLNGTTPYTTIVVSSSQVVISGLFFGVPIVAYSVETGTATTGTGITGAAAPAWNATQGLATQDNTLQWVNMGPSVQNWGADGPTAAPTVTQAAAPSIYPDWAASTWYAPKFVIVDSNGNLQQLTTAGTTGGAAPVWNVTVGGVTADNTANWTNLGTGAWVASHAYAVGAVVQATYTYTITVPQGQLINGQWQTVYVQQQVTITSFFTCITAGTSDVNAPNWVNGLNTTTNDHDVVWQNNGTPPGWPGAAAALSLATKVLDANGSIQVAQVMGASGAAAPTWATDIGATTPDNSQRWLNQGPYAAANQYAWMWAYSGKNSITGHITTASPISAALVVAARNLAVIQGLGMADPQLDKIVLWRTVQNGSLLLYDDEFTNPGAGRAWVYTDTNQDPSSTASPSKGQLNFLITAPINSVNNRPPAGFIPQAFYLGRIWGYVGNRLVWSGGPDTITGAGNEAFPPLNQTTFPSAGVTCWATSIGLICYTRSDVWVVLGQGTANSPFYVVNFQAGVGLANQDAFTVNGSTAYGMLTSGQMVSMDPGAGELEIGFPIGDQFDELYSQANTYCAWHQGSSADMALYVADGSMGWFRMAAVAAPESGNVWSNRALIQGGVKAIASLEIQPGVRRLLLGPSATGPILMRDMSARTDNGATYEAHADIGSIQMAQPGMTVGVQFITTEELAIAGKSPVTVSTLFDEIVGNYSPLRFVTNDPPNLEPSKSVTAQRAWCSQDANVSICRNMMVRLGWAAEDAANELFTYTIYGRLPQKARK